MSEFEKYSEDLLRSSKYFLELGKQYPINSDDGQRNLRASITHAFFFLEAQLNYIADHFSQSKNFDILERSLLSEKEISLEKGKFILSGKPKFYRIEDRIDFLLSRFSPSPQKAKSSWHPNLKASILVRNRLVHPKKAHQISVEEAESCILAVLGCLEALYDAVFGKQFQLALLGLHPGPTTSSNVASRGLPTS